MHDSFSTKGHTTMTNMAGEITKKAYDKETFAALMECCSRLFFCDEEIVIIDLFLATEKAISERDMEDQLGISDNRLREHLNRLEKHGMLKRFSNVGSSNIFQKTGRSFKKELTKDVISSQSFWRINNHVLLAVHYKLSKMEEILQQRLKGLYESDKFICPKCESSYDALTVQTLEIDGFDAHFICKCGTKVELDDKSAKEDIYSSQQKRFEEQVKTLKKCLFDAWGMEVPEFPVYVKKTDKSLGESSSNQETTSVVGDNVSVTGAGSSVVSDSSTSPITNVGLSAAASDPGLLDSGSIVGRTDNRKIKFHMRVTANDKGGSTVSHKPQLTKPKEVPKQEQVLSHTKSFEEPEAQNYQQHMTNLEFEVSRSINGEYNPSLEFCRVARQIFKFAVDGRARSCELILPHGVVKTPVFMPVGTKATIKGISYSQLDQTGCVLSLGNTYHLAFQPGKQVLAEAGGIHKFTESNNNFLTDSGGFQMVSLCALSKVTEEGVLFSYPYDKELEILLTPEESINTQNQIGADIIMALDDVVSSVVRDKERLELATYRTTRWLDRCIEAHLNPDTQSLFAIVQGSVYPDLRRISLEQLKMRDLPGYAIGGLSGGENKMDFWRTVELCTREGVGLPFEKPRYLMGVGYQIDIIVSVALGCDMFDCVFPTRTARFGTALTEEGSIKINHSEYQFDFRPLDENCDCPCCKKYSRAFLHYGFKKSLLVPQLMTIHNINYMMKLLDKARVSIEEGHFSGFVRQFLINMYINKGELPPLWVRDSLLVVGINIMDFYPENTHVTKCFD